MITKAPWHPDRHEFVELVHVSAIVSSSIRSDFSVMLKSFRQSELTEYEKMLDDTFKRLMDKAVLACREKHLDGIYNSSVALESLFSGSVLLTLVGDGVRER